jgi:YVTN family beta-propeller protein
LALLMLVLRLPGRAQNASAFRASSSAIALTPNGDALLIVNPDSNSLTLVDTATRSILAELTVGVDPRSVAVAPDGGSAYVANQGSDGLAVIDLQIPSVTTEVDVGGRPVGVAVSPDGATVAIAELGDDRVRLLRATDLSTREVVAVPDRPHGLAFTPDSRRLLVTHLLSGEVTILTVSSSVIYLPLLLRGSPQSSDAALPTPCLAAPPRRQLVTWPNVAPAPAVVVNASGTRAYVSQTMANALGLNTGFDTSVFPKVSVLNLESETHQTSEHISLPEVDRPVGLPWDMALAHGDTELWVVNPGSNSVSVVDIGKPDQPTRRAHVTVGDNPRGVALSPDGNRVYVNNTLAGTVSVIDAGTYQVTDVITVTDIPLPPALLHGKRLYHSSARPDLAQAAWISCNTCHVEGEHDGRTWLLQYIGEVPPGARPVITRNTTSLLGMIETYPLRWSAEWDESADSEFSIRFEQFGDGLIDGVMHPTDDPTRPNQGRSYDLDCLALFIDSLAVPERSHVLTDAEQRGKAIFESPQTACSTCHPAPLYTDLQVHDVGTAGDHGEWFGPLIDTPTLRFLYDSAPYLHDGSAATLRDVVTSANRGDEHGVTSQLTEDEIGDLIGFLMALPYTE